MTALGAAIGDGMTMFGRRISQVRRRPGELVAGLIVPIVLVVLFGYVFGSAIQVPGGGDYREYLMPGMFGMVAFTAVMANTMFMATDATKGVVDRFRSLPIARWAMPFGQSAADLVIALPGMVTLLCCAFVVGWRPHEGALRTLAGFGLLLLMRTALGWAGIFFGLAVKDDKTADAFVPLVFPVTMLSNTFVPTGGMPAWLRVIAEWNPVSALVAALRHLFGNPGAPSSAWPLTHPVTATLLWTGVLLAVFVPLSVRAYNRRER
ncbi:ABC-2 type transport system permease protein [Actinocorallia herbida]|uniref:Transport permease protein n=1 Tax=Actinocorallia herbida TaxID=58109 RepID=A0A3N1D5P9_9ACTN|nr:ABC transporter permease [Actinocorallia herbida]ROO88873.1 ABC-2 type transport system permease protein [Actinocorallia herbida]